MRSKVKQAALLVVSSLVLSGCNLFPPNTATPAKKPAAPDYQAATAPHNVPAARLSAICYNEADLGVIRARMLQQELTVATLQCQTPNGARAFEGIYTNFLKKFGSELSANARSLTELSRRKKFNVDVLVTEFANRTAQRPPVEKDFCARSLRAFEWTLDPKVTSLNQAPPPYDIGPEMNIHPCPPK